MLWLSRWRPIAAAEFVASWSLYLKNSRIRRIRRVCRYAHAGLAIFDELPARGARLHEEAGYSNEYIIALAGHASEDGEEISGWHKAREPMLLCVNLKPGT
jgi:hypothetical protein